MKNVLLYYNFSYPLGGGDILPLTFASYLQSRCELTLAVDSEAGFRRALEAFGAAHILQEILTIKSDDVVGRSKAYEAIVKGEPMPTPGIPESFNVLMHELKGLGLSLHLE